MLREWDDVVDAWQLETWEAYRDVRRVGRKRKLPENKRVKLWTVFDRVRISALMGMEIIITEEDRKAGSLPGQIKAAAKRQSIVMPDGWKPTIAAQLVSDWTENRTILPDSVLDVASALFNKIRNRFE